MEKIRLEFLLMITGSVFFNQISADCETYPLKHKSFERPCIRSCVIKRPCGPKLCPIILTPKQDPLSVFLDGLYWQSSIGNSDWMVREELDTLPAYNFQTTFKTHLGFRLGIEFNLTHDDWSVEGVYSRLTNKAFEQVKLFPAEDPLKQNQWGLHEDPASSHLGEEKIKFRYQQIETILGKNFFLSQYILLKPYIGLKALQFNLSLQNNYHENNQRKGDEYFTHLRFLGIGALAGFNTQFLFIENNLHAVALFMNLSSSLLYGHSRSVRWEKNVETGFQERMGKVDNMPRPSFQLFSGVSWSIKTIEIQLGYEFQYLLRQYQRIHRSYLGSYVTPRTYFRLADDVILHGLTARLSFNF